MAKFSCYVRKRVPWRLSHVYRKISGSTYVTLGLFCQAQILTSLEREISNIKNFPSLHLMINVLFSSFCSFNWFCLKIVSRYIVSTSFQSFQDEKLPVERKRDRKVLSIQMPLIFKNSLFVVFSCSRSTFWLYTLPPPKPSRRLLWVEKCFFLPSPSSRWWKSIK